MPSTPRFKVRVYHERNVATATSRKKSRHRAGVDAELKSDRNCNEALELLMTFPNSDKYGMCSRQAFFNLRQELTPVMKPYANAQQHHRMVGQAVL